MIWAITHLGHMLSVALLQDPLNGQGYQFWSGIGGEIPLLTLWTALAVLISRRLPPRTLKK
jgi:hypothetical protein